MLNLNEDYKEIKNSTEIKTFVALELMSGTTIKVNNTVRKAIVTDPNDKKIVVSNKEYDEYLDDFSNSSVSEDQELDFDDYLLYRTIIK